MCKALEEVAQQVGTKSIQAVAIAYVMQKTTHVFPIIGGRKVEHLEANIEALGIALSDEQIKYLESVLPFDKGFPHGFVVSVFFGLGTSSSMGLTWGPRFRAMGAILLRSWRLMPPSRSGLVRPLSARRSDSAPG